MDEQSASGFYASGGKSHQTLISIVLGLLLIIAVAFGAWAFSGRQDYKNHTDQKIAVAVVAAKKTQAAQLQAAFAEQEKSPFKTFHGSPTFGSISFNYPKTWSVYDDTTNSSEPINGYFHPDVVPGVQSKTAFALRVELVSTDYTQVMQQFSGQITEGKMTATAYVPPKLKGAPNVVAGSYLSGPVNLQNPAQTGYMLVIKVRDKTLEIYTDTPAFQADFNNTVLDSLTFAP